MPVVLITGTSSGIGLATALHFARRGHEVWAGLRNPAAAGELTQAVERERLPIRPVTIDVDDAGSVERGVGDVLDRAGRIDVLTKARRFADPASPYVDHLRRLLLFYQMQMKMPSRPEDVAAVIHEAVTTTEPRLRWLVGEDARRWDAGRRRLTDEEYVAGARPMPDQEYLDQLRRRFGFEWP